MAPPNNESSSDAGSPANGPPLKKPVRWVGNSLSDLRRFPDEARREMGFQLDSVQSGEMPDDFKPMSSVGSGVYEIRVRESRGDQYRTLYVAKFEEAIYVLHAFQKKTQKTEKRDLDIARKRYRQLTGR